MLLLLDLPPDVISSILCEWCEGIAISTFLLTHTNAMEFVHGALIARIDQLAKTVPHQNELLHVLALLREDMMMMMTIMMTMTEQSSVSQHSNRRLVQSRTYSNICAVLDYFESQMSQYVVYVGNVGTSWGSLGVWLTTPVWSVNATHVLYHEYELNYFTLERPKSTGMVMMNGEDDTTHHPLLTSVPFGSLLGLTEMDARYVDRVRQKLEGYEEVYKRMVTPSSCAFEDYPPLLFTTHSFAIEMGYDMRHGNKSLCCYWEEVEGFREDAIVYLAENVIRIMTRMIQSEDEDKSNTFRSVYRKKMGSVNVIDEDDFDDDDNDDDYDDDIEEENDNQ
jgi:hypothetical protein